MIFMYDQAIENFSVKVSTRARRMRLTIYPEGRVIATVPLGFSAHALEAFVAHHAGWILGKLEYFKKFGGRIQPKGTRNEYLKYKEIARALAADRIAYFSDTYDFQVKKVSIKNQKTMWGSCSRLGNINFNYKIALLSPRQADYIIVHELCHLKEFNHSYRFWQLVSEIIPEYRQLRKEIKSGRVK